jgi:uncharacterized protein YkwD/uncharacterized membrane protein required for colicin V production
LNWLDLIIVLLVASYALVGWKTGFVMLMLNLIGLVFSIVAALLLYSYVSPLFRGMMPQPGMSNVIAFLVLLILINTLAAIALQRFGRRLPRRMMRSRTNRVFGLVLGSIKGVVVCAVALLVLASLPMGVDKQTIEGSAIGAPLLRVGTRAERVATSVIPERVRKGLGAVIIEPQEGKPVKIPATDHIRLDTGAENRMLVMVNEDRTSRGLRPLMMDAKLRNVAREHSRDMFERGYFSHVTPDGVDPFKRMHGAGIRFFTAGENLAMAPTVTIAHRGLMNSPGHRENILNPAFKRVGIGVYSNAFYGKVFSQEFTN